MLTKTVVVLLVANFLCVQSQHKGKYFPGFIQTNKPSDVQQKVDQTSQEVVEIVRPNFSGQTGQIFTGPQKKVVESPITHQPLKKSNIVDHSLLTEEEKAAIKNAKYNYGYQIDDRINGGLNEKVEERKDGKVTGYYTYDDRNILRKVKYEADENGFRVISDEILPSARRDIELDGTAVVKTINNAEQNTVVIAQKEENKSTEPDHVSETIIEKTTESARGRRIKL